MELVGRQTLSVSPIGHRATLGAILIIIHMTPVTFIVKKISGYRIINPYDLKEILFMSGLILFESR